MFVDPFHSSLWSFIFMHQSTFKINTLIIALQTHAQLCCLQKKKFGVTLFKMLVNINKF